MVPLQQVVGHLTDRGTPVVVMAPHGEQKLVLGRGQPEGLGLLLAPAQESAEPRAQGEEVLVLGVRQMHRVTSAS